MSMNFLSEFFARRASKPFIKVVLSSGSSETLYSLKVYSVGLLSEWSPGEDQLLMSVLPQKQPESALLFDGNTATVTWGVMPRPSSGPVTGRPLVDGRSWRLNNRLDALRLYQFLAGQLRRDFQTSQPRVSSGVGWWKTILVSVAIVLGLSMVFALGVSEGREDLSASSPLAGSVSAPAPSAQISLDELYRPAPEGVIEMALEEARATPKEIASIFALKGKVAMRPSGIPFYVFSDPNCPFCKDLETSLAELDPKYQPIMIPLGFRNGSFEKSADVLCQSPGDQAGAWSALMNESAAANGQGGEALCDEGAMMVTQNQMLFGQLGLTKTPTMVTPSGIFVVGSAGAVQLERALAR